MVERVTQVLEAAFPGIELDLETSTSSRVQGSAIWMGIDGLDQVDRQMELRAPLNTKLDAEASQVSVILTYTPYAIRAIQEV
jgi:hypothetical protein